MVTLLTAFAVLSSPANGQPPGNTIAERGVILTYGEGVNAAYPPGVASVVSVAKQTLDGLFPDRAKDTIYVELRKSKDEYYESTVTDRVGTIYIGVGPKGIGEHFRGDAGSIGILCQAVAEVHNPNRLPGFDRYIAHRYLAPAVVGKLGADVLPGARATPGQVDATGTLAVMGDPIYAEIHPDVAAGGAMMEIDREVGFEGLKDLIESVPEDAADPYGFFREATLALNPRLAGAFAHYDAALALKLTDAGDCIAASFEQDEDVVRVGEGELAAFGTMPLLASAQFEVSQSDEWATHGELSLKLEAATVRPYMGLQICDPDWKYRDWTRFSRFEMDLKYEGDEPQRVYGYASDDPGRGHGGFDLFSANIQPGQVKHVLLELTPARLQGSPARTGVYFGGAMRAREVSVLAIMLPNPTSPFILYIDNLRFKVRERGRAAAAPPPADVRPQERQAQAAALLAEAVTLKRNGRLGEAVQKLQEALRLDDANPEVHRVLGWTLLGLDRKTEAAAAFRRVLELNPPPRHRRRGAGSAGEAGVAGAWPKLSPTPRSSSHTRRSRPGRPAR